MSQRQPTDPVVQIGTSLGMIIFVSVMMFLVFAREQMKYVGWVVIPLAIMTVLLASISCRNRRQR